MLDFYADFENDCIIHPTDYIDRYTRDLPKPSLIYLGRKRHWRTIDKTTVTFLISRRILLKYWDIYMKLVDFNKKNISGENQTINLIYKKEKCFSPIPSLAAHFSPSPEMPRFVNWELIFVKIRNKIMSSK